MADLNKQITIKLVIDGKEAIATLDLTKSELAGTGKAADNTNTQLGGFKDNWLKVAGAVATVTASFYTFKKAFDLAEQAAQLDVLRENFTGTAADLELFRKATANTVSEANLIKLSNQATDLGVSLEQQALLFHLADEAGDKYGTGVEEGFAQVLSATEGNIRGLKSLGIQKEVYEETIKDLAKVHGDEISKLDAETQKQIQLEAIIKSSGVTIADVNNKVQDNADKYAAIGVAAEEAMLQIGSLIGSQLSPFLDIISDITTNIHKESDAMREQQVEFNALIAMVQDSNTENEIRNQAIETLNTKYKDYLGNLELEKASYQDIAAAAKLANDEFIKRIKLTAAQEQIAEIMQRQVKLQKNLFDQQLELNKAIEKGTADERKTGGQFGSGGKTLAAQLEENIRNIKQSIEETSKEYSDFMNFINKEGIDLTPKQESGGGGGGSTGGLTDEEKEKLFRDNEAVLKEAQRHSESLLKIQTDNEGLMLLLKIKHFDEMIALYKKFGQDTTTLVNQRMEAEAMLTARLAPRGIEAGEKKKYQIIEQSGDATEKLDKQHQKILQRSAELTTKDKLNLLYTEKDAVADSLGQISSIFAHHTLAYQAFSKAQALIDTYTAAQAAYKAVVGVPFVGPALAVAAAIAATVAGLARVEQIGKVEIPKGGGFESGGRLPKGKAGIFEGTANEIVAPESDFKTYSAELTRQALIEARNYISVSSSASSSEDLRAIKTELKELKQAIIDRPALAYLDDREAKKIVMRGGAMNRRSKI